MKLDSKESINFTLRMPVSQRIELEKISSDQGRTVTNLINYVMSEYVADYRKKQKK